MYIYRYQISSIKELNTYIDIRIISARYRVERVENRKDYIRENTRFPFVHFVRSVEEGT